MARTAADVHRGDNLRDQWFVKVFTANRTTIDAGWNSRDVCSGYWRLYVNSQAGASLDLGGGGLYPLTPQRVHLVPAWVRFSCRNTRPVEHFFIHFDLIGVTAAAIQRVFTNPSGLPADRRLMAWVRDIDFRQPPAVVICEAKALIYAALAELFRHLTPQSGPLLLAPGPVAPALRHIEDHLDTVMTNAQLAALCHFSEDHFGRVFRQRLEQTPAQYILERRIATATQWLAFGEDSIEQIAERLGFANRYHLTRMFTRRMGCGPAAYRRRARV